MKMLNSKFRSTSQQNVIFCETCGANELVESSKKYRKKADKEKIENFNNQHENCEGIQCVNCNIKWENIDSYNNHASK